MVLLCKVTKNSYLYKVKPTKMRMKSTLYRLFGAVLVTLIGCTTPPREVVILSTNDIHAQIDRFAELATAVERCRDTAEVILVDAGDRWTGNAYVDLAEDRRPILTLMNYLGYDLATIGNHEFDVGQEQLERAVGLLEFPIICANINHSEGAVLKEFEPTRTIRRGGITVTFAGVVTNYGPNGHPDGHDAIFEGLTFGDAVETAAALAPTLKSCDVRVALTHVGLDRDREIAAATSEYDLIIGGHSHDKANERVNGTLITQTGKNLRAVGATTIRMSEAGPELEFRLIPLEGYEPDPAVAAKVAELKDNPALHRSVGELTQTATRPQLALLFAESIRTAAEAEIGIYHYGGVRLDSLSAGSVPLVDIYTLEPFSSQVSVIEMTPAELRKLIVAKFNDTVKPSESHCIDLFSTTPYRIVTKNGEATTVEFPTLDENRRYRVALGDYIFKTYKELHGQNGTTLDLTVTDAILQTLAQGPYTPKEAELAISNEQ